MTLLSAESISRAFADQVILSDVSFTIGEEARIALVGRNGIGKTTLLELLADKQRPDTGKIIRSRSCRIDYVEQEKDAYLGLSLHQFVADARPEIIAMRHEIDELEQQLQKNPDDTATLSRLGETQQQFERRGGFIFESEINAILSGLGFETDRFGERLANFSGGEKNRAGLARLLAGEGNLLLLDEPTNHLDIESTTWLESYLLKLKKACVIVSHDRDFLTNVIEVVWEMTGKKLDSYAGGFNRYLVERVDRRRIGEHRYKHQQEEIARIKDYIRRNIAGQKSRQAKSKLKYLDRMKRLPPPQKERAGPSLSMRSSGRSFAHVVAVDNVTLAYGDRVILRGINFDIYRGEKVGLIGRNGSGKSTMLKALIGELEPAHGSVKLGNGVEVAYFDQALSELPMNNSVLQALWEVDPMVEMKTVRSFLARFGFSGDDVLKSVAALSGGEKTKLCLARLLYHPANLIILDEPTNHLDMPAREALEQALIEYDGSLIVVSHDRYFLRRVVDKIVYVTDGSVTVYNGGYDEFRERMSMIEDTQMISTKSSTQTYQTFKQLSRTRGKRKKELQSVRSKISDKERELAQVESDILKTVPAHDWEQLQQSSEKKKLLENEILSLFEQLERLEREENVDN